MPGIPKPSCFNGLFDSIYMKWRDANRTNRIVDLHLQSEHSVKAEQPWNDIELKATGDFHPFYNVIDVQSQGTGAFVGIFVDEMPRMYGVVVKRAVR